ncbi:50S ribosomal protein L3 [Candidatus Saccharibacteria bacterium]|nr:50S ribosomal protein L3 [Candidatus Saccharibacteria bacterium]NIV03847.1 50S ribosomal protein L3 [Calditrichia bacterium]NIS38406.1 50S ribosomal protein L3 [Candidatus Saccharibacteria bacterium]NIV72182.1 50S ribosomal protein L3 [Calditrichia bacterium]NIV99095.1 50S ribosomal protein L3 [Candidatus Saccharibacteria bacterium]
MKFIIGTKIEMGQVWNEAGERVPVTWIKADPCKVTQVKTDEKDGYSAVQIGCGEKKRLIKPLAGHLKDLPKFRYLKEFRVSDPENFERGKEIKVTIFEPGDKVAVAGTSKGRGFAGVVKRHGFHGSPASHGHKDQLRMPGSIGATDPAHVFKGTKMGGQMGAERVMVKNLEIVQVDEKENRLAIKGAVPGARNSLVEIIAQ